MSLRLKCTLFCSPTTVALSSDLSPVWAVPCHANDHLHQAPRSSRGAAALADQPNQVDIGARMEARIDERDLDMAGDLRNKTLRSASQVSRTAVEQPILAVLAV